MVGKIQRVPLREVWPHESLGFTKWLETNIDVLGDALGLTLSNVEREHDCGDFSVDLVAESDGGGAVVIENQLGRSDHDHLGKLLTYLSVLDAQVAVWVVGQPRPEHTRAVGWLNQSGLAKFYLVKVEAIRINESSPAPLFTLITGPSAEQSEAGEQKKEMAERHDARKRFFTQLLERAKERSRLHANISASSANWVGASAGRTGLAFNYVILQHEARVELYIDVDTDPSGAGNERLFDELATQRTAIERDFGGPLVWESLDGKRACRISAPVNGGGWKDESHWPQLQDNLISSMVRLEKAMRPRLERA